jgi:hypothetical protein
VRIVIFGANGPTGRLLTRLSLTAGYDTVAVTRQPGTFPLEGPQLRVAGADVLDAATPNLAYAVPYVPSYSGFRSVLGNRLGPTTTMSHHRCPDHDDVTSSWLPSRRNYGQRGHFKHIRKRVAGGTRPGVRCRRGSRWLWGRHPVRSESKNGQRPVPTV